MYDFSQLSPIDFEELVRDLLAAHFNTHVEAFGPGADQGIDARFSGKAGTTIIQAKHFLRSGKSALLSKLKLEDPKVAKLKPCRYILATSVSLNPEWKNKIKGSFSSINVETQDIFGQEDLNALLREHPAIEKSHFKLWLSSTSVLERIVHSEIYNRTEIEIDIIKDMVPKFVPNKSIEEAEEILSNKGSLIISGHPGVGKTTLARMLSWLHAAQGWDVFVIDEISDAYKIPNNSKKRLVLFDDFLGQVRLSPDHVRGLDSKLPPFLTRAENDKKLRFILTTRQYILSQAAQFSSRLNEKSNESRYILNVGKYTRSIRAQILYNHIHFAGMSDEHIDAILDNKFYLNIIDHPNFNPRLIEILTSSSYSKLAPGDLRSSIEQILANPSQLWDRPFREHISEGGRALLVALLLFERSASMEALRNCFPRLGRAMGLEIPPGQAVYRFNSALKELEGSAIYIVNDSVQFSNPGVRDYLQSVVTDDRLIPHILLQCEDIREVTACWLLSEPSRAQGPHALSDAEIWLQAMVAERVLANTPVLDGLSLSLQTYAYFGDERLLQLALKWAASMAGVDIEPSESDVLLELLLQIDSLSCPEDLKEILRAAVLNAIYEILENRAEELAFSVFEEIDLKLFLYGNDEARAAEASRNAMRLIIDDIENVVEEYGSVDELDEFEERLKHLANVRAYAYTFPRHEIEQRREYLEYKASESYDDYERPSRSGVHSISPDSDSAISSIFDNLKG